MIKIVTVIGARPQIIKAAALSRAIKINFADRMKEVIIHTGQHYDDNMSEIFFNELQIPKPDYNLNVGSGTHGKQTASMIEAIEEVLLKEKPKAVILYGDTNSTLAGALAASKINIPIVHIEAGMRSFNKTMPEEINRIVSDHLSTLLFAPTLSGYKNLIREGFQEKNIGLINQNNPKIVHCGDIMYDNSIYFSELAERNSNILFQNNLEPRKFILTTIHRDNNTDDAFRLSSIFNAINKISIENKINFIIPLHPRTTKLLTKNLSSELYYSVKSNDFIKIIPPVSFFEMIVLEKNARIIITDSGGVQKEAYFFHKPCIILRNETEWVELLESGCAMLVDADDTKINAAFNFFSSQQKMQYPNIFGDGKAAEFICNEIINNTN